MGSQGGGSGSDGMEVEVEVEVSLQSLWRQGSLYSLTLDEIQNQLGGSGKSVESMNIDELLRNVWSFEEDSTRNGLNLDSSSASLNRQLSFSLSRDLSKKTVEEVWKDIEQGKKKGESLSAERYYDRDGERGQPTLGEMTLEDFLVKAGVECELPDVGGAAASQSQPQPQPQRQPQWMMNYEQQEQQQQQQQQQQKGMTVFMGVDGQMSTLSDTPGAGGRKRGSHGVVVEKIVERRQKRMIKNRESAARSRARKQAYTHELENKVSRLEEEIERLRRLKEVEKVLPSAAPPSEPKNRLPRTSSAPF